MGEINLLPEEFREKEEKELAAIKKLAKVVKIEMTSPAKAAEPKLPEQPKPSLLSRLFFKKTASAKPIMPSPPLKPPKPPELGSFRPIKKVLHIPAAKTAEGQAEDKIKPPFIFGRKEKPEAVFVAPTRPETPPFTAQEKKLIPPEEKVIEIKERIKAPHQKLKFNLFFWLKPKARKEKIKKEKEIKEKIPLLEKQKLVAEKERAFDINLIPKELAEQQKQNLSKKLVVCSLIVFIFITLVGATYLGITWYQLYINRQIQELKSEIEDLNGQIAGYEKSKLAAVDLQQRLKLISELLNKHIYWTKFFALLEKYTVKEVYYTNFSMAGTQKLVLSAVGKDYESVAKQLVAFQKAADFVASVDINSAAAEVDKNGEYLRVVFNINLTFLPEVFLKPIE